ncbi:hypothetical protein [Streptomyces sp. NPDC005547]|uniref:hypothetical protein n=1 Tax=unclassified Streptomyces TaxID=2593676 RepID=UPI0033A33743
MAPGSPDCSRWPAWTSYRDAIRRALTTDLPAPLAHPAHLLPHRITALLVLKVVAQGNEVASEVEVPHEDLGLFRAASFWTVRDGQVVRGTEYWTSVGADPLPEWRTGFVEPM